ncbi:T-cell receptor-associated transmembrane adapter 1 [Trichosurus vulpecula]|uniref:T-cell receptor-associated transmembrane adapter 1 n=1 Tax=Trichosurus vulpecula TaxID=9337 RepID=UPI00186B283A|nr:T-cell receptor-associated transmembrane adapter 1 [Trichosurus vulpecula]
MYFQQEMKKDGPPPSQYNVIYLLFISENDQCPIFVWGLLAFLSVCLIMSLILNVSYWLEKRQQDKTYDYTDDYIPGDFFQRGDEYYTEDAPIYGNLDNVLSGPTDENCYEQMKARPERAVNEKQECSPMQEEAETRMCYASLDHSFKGKCRKPKAHFSHEDEDEKSHAVDTMLPKSDSIPSFREESDVLEENIHDDPIRLFGLIYAKKEQMCVQDYDPA